MHFLYFCGEIFIAMYALFWFFETEKLNPQTLSFLECMNIVDNDGESALLQAVRPRKTEALKLLLDVPNIDVNFVNKIPSEMEVAPL